MSFSCKFITLTVCIALSIKHGIYWRQLYVRCFLCWLVQNAAKRYGMQAVTWILRRMTKDTWWACDVCWVFSQVQPTRTDTRQTDADNVGDRQWTGHPIYSSDGQIQIMIWFKSWLNHWWWFDLSTKDLIWKRDLIRIWFHFTWYDLWFEQITTFSNLGQRIMITMSVFLLRLS